MKKNEKMAIVEFLPQVPTHFVLLFVIPIVFDVGFVAVCLMLNLLVFFYIIAGHLQCSRKSRSDILRMVSSFATAGRVNLYWYFGTSLGLYLFDTSLITILQIADFTRGHENDGKKRDGSCSWPRFSHESTSNNQGQ